MNVIHLIAVLAVALGDTACGKVHYPQGDQKNPPSRPTSPPGDWPMTEYEKEQTKKAVEVLDLLRLWEYDSLVNPNNRRIVGEYTLDLPDMERGAVFEDGITVVHFNIDIHDAKNNGQRWFKTKPYQIPYRCLIPRGIEGMLVAGRAISGSHVAMASYRVTGDCCAMGEAAGYAAAEAVRQNKSVRAVTVDEIMRHKNGMDE